MRPGAIIFILLSILYLSFSFSIYVGPSNVSGDSTTHSSAGEGKLVWQKYNCQSCHQLYGLGGYLGPDLTNIYSEQGKGPSYIVGMVRAGTMQMPAFSLSANEEKLLLEFLKAADASGNADPRGFKTHYSGMIERK